VSMAAMHEALERQFRDIPKKKRHTYTYDNGTELGQEDAMLERRIGMAVYRAYPYHSWERGSNENWNAPTRSKRISFTKSTSARNSSSVSPG